MGILNKRTQILEQGAFIMSATKRWFEEVNWWFSLDLETHDTVVALMEEAMEPDTENDRARILWDEINKIKEAYELEKIRGTNG